MVSDLLRLAVPCMKDALAWVEVIFALAAAIFWLWASCRKVNFDPHETDDHGGYPLAMTELVGGRQIDLLKTAANQTRWNSRAAFAAAIAAACQAILMALPR